MPQPQTITVTFAALAAGLVGGFLLDDGQGGQHLCPPAIVAPAPAVDGGPCAESLVLALPCDGDDADDAACGVWLCPDGGPDGVPPAKRAARCTETDVPRAETADDRDNDCDGLTDEAD